MTVAEELRELIDLAEAGRRFNRDRVTLWRWATRGLGPRRRKLPVQTIRGRGRIATTAAAIETFIRDVEADRAASRKEASR